ncbi:MAG: hypothetical protein KIT72_00410 [Polyangiaceae bacterium]|nr:hypothetical protein [Polyangiaceae bacterium]MCW5788858.1 hypothetical protein [Polyangiaceae bacterium]
MNWRRRLMWAVFFTVLGGVIARWHGLRVSGPHELVSVSARLSPSLERRIDRLAASRRVDSPRKAIDLALELTSQGLKYGAPTPGSGAADGAERTGGSEEYTALFVAIFNRVADGQGIDATARPVQSAGPRLFGVKLPGASFAHHHWALVQPKGAVAAESWFVDPTLHDLLLGWSIEGNVTGLVPVSAEAAPEELDSEEEQDELYEDDLPSASKSAKQTNHGASAPKSAGKTRAPAPKSAGQTASRAPSQSGAR